jgi:hypothetical protein
MLKLPKNKTRLVWLGGVAGVLLLVLLLWKVPQWSVPDTVTDDQVRAELLNANRENVLKVIQTLAGLGFIATAYLAYRNFQLTEDRNVSDRFTKAVEMLADERLEVRLGGVYSLERIAKDSREDHPVVMEVLTAFIREKTTTEDYKQLQTTTADIQSALDVIGRRIVSNDLRQINLGGTNLQGAFLDDANLQGAFLDDANLQEAELGNTNLQRAHMENANLQKAFLAGANLQKAFLAGANLQEAFLEVRKPPGGRTEEHKPSESIPSESKPSGGGTYESKPPGGRTCESKPTRSMAF